MNKYLCIALAAVIMLSVSGAAYAVVYGQSGYENQGYSESTAWEINSAAVLEKVRDDINSSKTITQGGYFKLTRDIDLTSYTNWVPIGGKTRFGGEPSFFTGHCYVIYFEKYLFIYLQIYYFSLFRIFFYLFLNFTYL